MGILVICKNLTGQCWVIVELKAVEAMNKIYEAQLLTYLRAMNKRVGLLINFNVGRLKEGLKRLII